MVGRCRPSSLGRPGRTTPWERSPSFGTSWSRKLSQRPGRPGFEHGDGGRFLHSAGARGSSTAQPPRPWAGPPRDLPSAQPRGNPPRFRTPGPAERGLTTLDTESLRRRGVVGQSSRQPPSARQTLRASSTGYHAVTFLIALFVLGPTAARAEAREPVRPLAVEPAGTGATSDAVAPAVGATPKSRDAVDLHGQPWSKLLAAEYFVTLGNQLGNPSSAKGALGLVACIRPATAGSTTERQRPSRQSGPRAHRRRRPSAEREPEKRKCRSPR